MLISYSFWYYNKKDELGSDAFSENGIIQKSLKEIKTRFPEILIITDLCMEYTSHGHCGILNDGKLDNDVTLKYLQKASCISCKLWRRYNCSIWYD